MKVSQSGYFAWASRKPSKRTNENIILGEKMRQVFEKSRGNYGKRRIHAQLMHDGFPCGLERVRRLMQVNHLKVKTRRKFKSTTDSNHNKFVSPNLLKQNFSAIAPNCIWSSDISYIKTDEGWLYLCVVLDLYSRAIIGWSMSERMQATLVENAINSAVKQRKPTKDIIFHSDKGSQYCSDKIVKLLKSLKFKQSMSGRGNCYDNAVTETFFSTLKKELVYQCKYNTRTEAKNSIFEYIEVFYNRTRIHSSLDYVSPFEYEKRVA